MSIDFNKPVKTDNYDTGFLSSIRAHVVSLACMLDPADAGTISNTPTGARRWVTGGVLERYNGTSWAAMSVGYALTSTTISAGTGLSGGGSLAANRTLSLANTAVTPGSYGGNNSIPAITVDAQGRLTAASVVTPSGTWGISVSGNAATATKLATARTINGVSFDGTANVTVADATKLPLTGGTMSGNLAIRADNATPTISLNDRVVNGSLHKVGAILFGAYRDVSDPSWVAGIWCDATAAAGNTGDIVFGATQNGGTGWPTERMRLNYLGDLTVTGNVTAYSDAKLKRDVRLIDGALARVQALRGVTFERVDLDDGMRHTGIIAQELQAVLPEAVRESENGTLLVAYGNVIGLLIEAIKELRGQVDELRAAA